MNITTDILYLLNCTVMNGVKLQSGIVVET